MRDNRGPVRETSNGVSIRRLYLPTEAKRPIWRIINALHLGIRVLMRTLVRRYDVIIATSIPPVLGGFFPAMSARLTSARFIYYCMDLHPEIGRVSGDFSNPVLFRLLQRIDDWSCRQADPVLVHSEDMRQTLLERPHGSDYHIGIVNNFSLPTDEEQDYNGEIRLDKSHNRLTVVYAGNIGRFQRLETVVEAMCRLSHRRDIQLVIMGDGVAKQALVDKAQKGNANIRFIDYQPVAVSKKVIQQADIGLVTIIPETFKYAYPSKTMAYLELGKPIIAEVEQESELVRSMQSNGYGFGVPVGDVDAMADLLVELSDDESWKSSMSEAALEAFRNNFAPEVILARWSGILQDAAFGNMSCRKKRQDELAPVNDA